MPTYIKVGHHDGNKGKLTCKGFFIKRIGRKMYRRWGSIIFSGHTNKTIRWEVGYPQYKEDSFKSDEEAREAMRVLILRRKSNGYHQIVDGIK